ncbi:ABC transporter ATP-binding protein [Alsobacter metallidurans]|uniref:ABC transporter ATP-binding protein n=1 Tax=Alsobacter metallidurans TaxID=340221 RepID=A0A917I7V2_9HYPH|nr:ABC transporter ATP-binding protein [Alsobacter metallidurans]GGH20691.1 ABC transporter ATP-binding protein [Alsobacter metallidurans]
MSQRPVLDIRGLTLALPALADRPYAVSGLDLAIAPGELLCVVGESGSGKSMAAHAVMGLLPRAVKPVAGQVLLNGRDLLALDDAAMRDVRGREVGMIFQEPMTSLNPVMRVGDQIAETLEAHRIGDGASRMRRAVELMTEVGLPDPARMARAFPHQLSGGQRQRVMIAMALALQPKLLIADEPTTALDVTTQAQILKLVDALRRDHGTAVLFITHDFGVVAEIADRIAVLQHGVVVEQGPADAVLGDPRHDYTRRLLAAVPSLTPPPPRPRAEGEPVLSVKGLGKIYQRRSLFGAGRVVQAASDVSFSIARGETLGLVGESGSGKSTVGRCCLRLIEPDAGEIRIDELDITALSARAFRPHRKRIQMVFQDPFASLNPRRTVGRIIAEGPVAQGVEPKAALERARELLALVGLTPGAIDRYPHEFSGGQRQRIGIARALALDPEILVADEAVSALDVSVQAQILDLIQDLKKRLGLAILFVTHDLRVAAQICDRIAVMQRGEIVEMGDTATLFAAPKHPYTQQLLAAVPGARRLKAP